MKRILIFACIFVMCFGCSADAAGRVQLGLHRPESVADITEDFSVDLSLWNVEVENGANWHLNDADGDNALSSGPIDTWNTEDESIIVMTDEVKTKNFTFSIEAKDKRYGAMASLVFKYTSPQHFYSLRMLNIEGIDYIGFYRRNGVTLWQEERLTLVEFPGKIRTPEESYEIKVEVNDDKFIGYVDGTPVTEYTEDKEYFEGNRVGVFQSYGEPFYDNVAIYFDKNDDESDDDFVFNRQLLVDLGLWNVASKSGTASSLLTGEQFDYFMSKLCFAPKGEYASEYVTFDEVVSGFLRALGYNDIEETTAYHNAKSELQINVSKSGDNITLKDFVQMAVNSFDIDVVKKIYGGSDKYVIDGENTMLNVYHNIRHGDGVLTDNGIATLEGKTKLKKGNVAFDEGLVASVGDTDASYYLGYYMDYYYEDDDTPKLLNIRLNHTNELFLRADEILSYNNGTLTYCLRGNEETEKIKIPDSAFCVYNGIGIKNPQRNMFTPDSGSLTIISNGGKSGVDGVVICEYRDVVVDSVLADDMIMTDKLSGSPISWEDVKHTEFYNTMYVPMTVKDIIENDVVSIAKSLDGSYMTFTVCRNSVSGKVDKIDYGANKIIVNEREYVLSKGFMTKSFVSAGDNGTLYLNSDDVAVYFEHSAESAFTVAYLIDMMQSEDLDKRVWLQLFDGEVRKYPCAGTVKINDNVYKNNSSLTIIQNYRGVFDIFEYKLNSNGEISNIVFPQEDAERNDSRLSKIGGYSGGAYYKSHTRSFSGLLLADENAKVFLVPLDRSRVDAYALTDISYFKNDITYYYIVGYSRGDNDETAEYIVSEFNDTPKFILKDICVLTNISDCMTEDGEPTKMISVLFNGVEARDVVVDPDCNLDGAEVGNLIQYSTNLDKEVHEINRIYDHKNNYFYHFGNEGYSSSCRMVQGTIYDIKSSSFIFELADGSKEIVTTGAPVVLYDSTARKEKVRKIKTSDMRDYLSYGNGADRAAIRFEYGEPREIVIYR